MTGWVVRQFKGVAPRITPRQLPDNMAQSCANVNFKHGSLVPRKANTAVLTLPKSGTIKTVHRFGQDVSSDTQYWFHWATEGVNVVRGPVSGDVQERTYWTGDGVPKVTDSSIALTGGTQYPMASYTLGIPAPEAAPTAVVGGTPESATALDETRLYVVVFRSGWHEQGAPSLPSIAVSVKVGETVTLGLPAVPSGAYNITTKEIYRSVPGSLGTPYLFVAEVSAATTSYVDSKLADELGEELPSLDYEMPPAGLDGLVALPGGVMAGFVGKDIYFSEPFKPHAWPSKYSLTAKNDIVALGVFDATLLVLTKGRPELVSGTHPENYSQVDAVLQQACVSARSVVSADGGVIFASPDGLFLVGGGVTRNLTEATHSQEEWRALQPATLHGYLIDNQYVGFYGGTAGFVVDLATGDVCPLDWYAQCGFYDPIRDALFLVTGTNSLVKFDSGSALTQSWRSRPFYSPSPVSLGAARVEASAYPVTFKAHATAKDSTDAAAIRAVRPALSGAGSTLTYTATVNDDLPFRLPDGFTAKEWAFEVSSTSEVISAGFAETVQELGNG